MNQFYFGAMNQYIQTGYAPTGRAKCKKCKQQIQNNSLRIGILMDDDHFSAKYWYHLPCFQLKPRFKDMDPQQQIYNIDHLEPEDYDTVLAHVKDEVQRLKDGKKPTKKSQPPPKKEKSKSKSKKEESSESEQQQVKPKKGKSKTKSKVQQKKEEKASVKSDKSASKSVSRSKSVKSKASQKKKGKKKVAKKQKPKQGYTEAQKQQYKELFDKYMGMSSDALKNILAANSQSRTGNKSDLAEKCADGKILGKIPMCSSCGGGRLRFDRNTGIYNCPGYMDDDVFRHCGKKLTMSELVRQKWTEP